VDLSATNGLSSLALGQLVTLHATCLRVGHDLRLCGVSGALRGVFAATKLDQVFSFYSNLNDALQSRSAVRVGAGDAEL
jgi:anti-anti-sigma regulatory factor